MFSNPQVSRLVEEISQATDEARLDPLVNLLYRELFEKDGVT
jgi:hypothetical protein